MFRQTPRFPFAMTLLTAFALSPGAGARSSAQTLLVDEYFIVSPLPTSARREILLPG